MGNGFSKAATWSTSLSAANKIVETEYDLLSFPPPINKAELSLFILIALHVVNFVLFSILVILPLQLQLYSYSYLPSL